MKHQLLLLGMVGMAMACHAQNLLDIEAGDFKKFRKQIHLEFNDYRKTINQQYIDFVRNPWKEFDAQKPIPKPIEKDLPPVIIPKDEELPKKDEPIEENPIKDQSTKEEPIIDNPIDRNPVVIEEVVVPKQDEPQPEPIKPIEEVPVLTEKKIQVLFFGTNCSVRYTGDHPIALQDVSSNKVADALAILSNEEYDNLIFDCLKIRQELQLCDWAYLELLQTVSEAVYPKDSNEAELLMAYIYVQSGYRMRLASANGKLYMLFASRHTFYDLPCFLLDGEKFYSMENIPNKMSISEAKFPKEQNLSMKIKKPMKLADNPSEQRIIQSDKYKDIKVSIHVNKNLLEFYNTYPSTQYGEDIMTRWANYAICPLQEQVKEELYPQLQQSIDSLSQLDAANRILDWIQTGLEYEFDDKVWGYDRAFFAEETLFYPYCDCEDRSILLSRLIRDLLGLDVLLVYYPGHLATAIGFTEEVSGDYIMHQNKKYIVADPTYINAPTGRSMPTANDTSVKVILLHAS